MHQPSIKGIAYFLFPRSFSRDNQAGLLWKNEVKCTAVKMHHLDSSSLAAAGYDAGQHQLDIAFRHGGLYRYFGVPRRTYRALLQAESKGLFFTGRIRGHYRFEKLGES